ncbi:2-oxoadipate dioxygenase/decarboxylase HglS [Candidatus Pantoea multigeneris]|uniref:2-oxoadipate dioxygenase/decarboxylase n=1 Tax=Candidatus Pantoea multigeneris TaxID=2608357 RepID=A0ABX0RH24_9GAMM|nr:VOC family protein [Pantoea multigeneris]NIF24342.1 VOC family protein [Pantoea multigeneris]
MQRFISPDVIRDRFSKAMSQMYQREVPQYGTLLQIVQRVNGAYLQQYPATFSADEREEELNRLNVERHGAIRLGTAQELSTMRQLFAVMGMQPVSYYDLSAAGVPVHSTAFRATDEASLRFNPFRVFTSLLRLELIADDQLRQRAESILNQRDIFTPRARELIVHSQQQGGLDDAEADEFVREALETFRWHREAQVDFATYNALSEQHRLVADVVCFKGPHINHLTPRTLNIDAVQAAMPEYQITPKESIEGPPRRQVPILLRQTSFKALSEQIVFSDHAEGKHTARFGEIEQRGMALTPAGRALYDRLLQQNDAAAFTQFPDDETTLRQQKLGYFRYALAAGQSLPAAQGSRQHLEALLAAGVITATPIIYEDFLPVSAAGIFQSNLGSERSGVSQGSPNKAAFEAALGCQVTDEFSLYQALEEASLQRVFGEVSPG